MHITSNECDDEEDDLPLKDNKFNNNNNKITDKNLSTLSSSLSPSPILKTDKKQYSAFISCGLKRKLPSLSSSSSLSDNNISSNEEKIPKKKNFFTQLPSVSLKKLNCNQDRVVEENSKTIKNSDQILNNNLEILHSQINENKNSENHTLTSDELKNKTKIRKRKYQETLTESSSKNNDNNNNTNNKINSNDFIIVENDFLNKEEQEKLKSKQENNLENITEYKTPVRKFFKTRKSNVGIATVFSGGNYSYRTTELQQSSTTAIEEKLKNQKFKKPSGLYFLKPTSHENKEIIVKEDKPKKKKNNNNNIEKTNLNNKKNSNLSLTATVLSSDKFVVENKENCLLTFPLNENNKSATSSSNETAVIEKINDNYLADNFKTKFHNNPLSPIKLNNSNNNNNDIIDLTATEIISETRQKQQQQNLQKNQEQQINNNEQNEQTKTSVFNLLKRNHLNFVRTIPLSSKRKFIESGSSENSKKICSDMSVYDRRIQTDDRPSVNGYSGTNNGNNSGNNLTTNRGIHHHHHHHHHHNNEDITSLSSSNSTTTIMNNHYYQCPPPTPPQPTMATLCNIGNTCYLNSVIYTLRFAPMFLHNLHHLIDDLSYIQQNFIKYHNNMKSSSLGRNITGLHMENTRSWSSKDLASLENIQTSCDMPKSNQQIATEKLHELYQSLHRNECTETTEPFQADTFLHAIQDVSAIFEGNQQQDAHEFLMCVLDSIRETCQALIKAISECPDAIINGCISLPEQKESQCAVTTIPKEKSLQRESGSSAIIKTSFFSRKSKRKDAEIQKNLKSNNTIINNSTNNRLQSPHKDNTHSNSQQFQTSSDTDNTLSGGGGIGDTLNGSKHSLKSDLSTDLTKTTTVNLKDNKERLSDKIKKLGLDFFSEDFEGITVSTTKCLSCETITEQKETMIDIAVPITGYENIDLGEKFIQDSCVTKEYFRGENKYRCEQCMGYTEAIRSISYEVLPRLLVIQLSRFSGVMEKINTYLPTPFTLQCFCSKCLLNSSSSTTTTSSTSSSSCASADNKNQHIYKLYSVITHVGATMSVGHYIAYTCSLNWANDYLNCPKDHRMRQAQIIKQQQQQQQTVTNITNNTILNGPAERNVRHIKKMIFGRSKASSSGDMSKTVKSINGLSSSSSNKSFNNANSGVTTATAINSGDKQQQQNTICPSINCCGLQLRNNYLLNNLNYNNNSSGGGYYIDIDDPSSSSSSSVYNSTVYNSSNNSSSGYGTNIQQNSNNSNCGGSNSNNSGGGIGRFNRNPSHQNEPIWYMCDDDKIKAMSQREFEDMLSPNRKIMITPYLLFYARNDVQ